MGVFIDMFGPSGIFAYILISIVVGAFIYLLPIFMYRFLIIGGAVKTKKAIIITFTWPIIVGIVILLLHILGGVKLEAVFFPGIFYTIVIYFILSKGRLAEKERDNVNVNEYIKTWANEKLNRSIPLRDKEADAIADHFCQIAQETIIKGISLYDLISDDPLKVDDKIIRETWEKAEKEYIEAPRNTKDISEEKQDVFNQGKITRKENSECVRKIDNPAGMPNKKQDINEKIVSDESKDNISEITVKCPYCLIEHKFRTWKSINVTHYPDMKEAVKKGSAFMFKCPICKKETMVSYPTVYHDMKEKVLIQYTDSEEEDNNIQNLILGNIFKDTPFDMKKEHYRIRIVHSLDELAEKVEIFDQGLDDRIIECYKILILADFKEKNPGHNEINIWFFSNNNKNRFELIADGKSYGSMEMQKDSYDKLYNYYTKIFPEIWNSELRIDRNWAMTNFVERELSDTENYSKVTDSHSNTPEVKKQETFVNEQKERLFCRKCGKELLPDSLFCDKCGTKVKRFK